MQNFRTVLAEAVRKEDAVLIFGRGSSLRHFQKDSPWNAENKVTIGVNLLAHKDLVFDYCISSDSTVLNFAKPGTIVSPRFLQQEAERILEQTRGETEVISSFSLWNLLIVINDIARLESRSLPVHIIGFDFDGSSAATDVLYQHRGISQTQRLFDLSGQRSLFFRKARSSFSHLRAIHVGYDFLSDVSTHRFSRQPTNATSANSQSTSRVEIVAEITTNHYGSEERLMNLISLSAKAGVDAVKLQMRDVERFYDESSLAAQYASPFGSTFGDYRRALELDESQILSARRFAQSLGLDLFFSVLDEASFDKLKAMGFTRFKLPSTISDHDDFIESAARHQNFEWVVSTGWTDDNYAARIISMFGKAKHLFLLHCISAYPASYPNLNLNNIIGLKGLAQGSPNISVGYSSHDVGYIGSVIATALGSTMIEKHVRYGITPWGHFDSVAIDVQQDLPMFVESIRRAEETLGSYGRNFLADENHKYWKQLPDSIRQASL